eukprot:4919681-Pyramimonas_sp.AAC.1
MCIRDSRISVGAARGGGEGPSTSLAEPAGSNFATRHAPVCSDDERRTLEGQTLAQLTNLVSAAAS